jgi:hypothetical protein
MVANSGVGTAKGSRVRVLEDSAPLLDDPAALRKRWEDEGVLYFRNVIDRGAVAKVRGEYVERLVNLGLVIPDSEEPIWTGLDRVDGKAVQGVDDSLWQEFVAHPTFDGLVKRAFGEAPTWVPIVVHRVSHPIDPASAPEDTFNGRHQDGFYNNGINFVTCWVPLMDIDEEVGGLVVVPGSHKGPYLHDPENPPVYSIPRDAIPDEAWRRGDYHAGDVLIFHNRIAHAGLPNVSDRYRLSIDLRFLPSSAPEPVSGHIVSVGHGSVTILDDSGERQELIVNDDTFVRGPKGNRVTSDDYSEVLFEGNAVLIVPDGEGQARLIRTASRKFLDIPSSWYSELPPSYVV